MRCISGIFAALGLLVLAPAPAWPQVAMDAERTLRTANRYYAGAGVFALLASGEGADAGLQGGWVLGEGLQVGLEGGYAYRAESEEGDADDRTVDQLFVDATATWFPFGGKGAFVKGGLGYGTATEKWRAAGDWDRVVRESSTSGVSALVAAGWEIRVGRTYGLGVEMGALARPGLEKVDPRALLTLTHFWGRRP